LNQVGAFEQGLLLFIRDKHQDILDSIRDRKELTDETKGKLKDAVDAFAKTFA